MVLKTPMINYTFSFTLAMEINRTRFPLDVSVILLCVYHGNLALRTAAPRRVTTAKFA